MLRKIGLLFLSFIFLATALLPLFSVGLAHATSANLIANPSVETVDTANTNLPQSWLQGSWGTNTAQFSYPTSGEDGSRSVKVQISSYTSGDAKWYFAPVAVSANANYTFSDYYESNISSDIVAQFDDGGGNYTYVDLGNQAASSSAWALASVNLTTPSTAKYVTIFHLISSVGWLSTDNFSLDQSVVASAPTVSLTAPTANATVSGTSVQLAAKANDANGITSVQFQIDGKNVGSPLTSAPYQMNWDSTTVTNGIHTVTAVATNKQGATATASAVTISVNNGTVVQSGNLVPNASVETADPTNSGSPLDWQTNSWGTNTTTFSYLNSGQDGSRSVEVQMTKYTSGDAKWFFNPVNIEAGGKYTFSDYYKATVPTEIDAAYTMSDGSAQYVYLGTLAASSTWQQLSMQFTAPAGTVAATVFHIIYSVGTLTTDNFSLSSSSATTPPTDNLVPNPLMTTADPSNPKAPQDWQVDSWGTNKFTSSYDNTGSNGDPKSVKIQMKSYTSGDAKWFFTPQNVSPDTQYSFSEYYKATVPTQVDAVFTMADGSTDYEILGVPDPASGWTKFTAKFSVPLGAQTLTIYHFIQSVGTLSIDNENLSSYVPSGFSEPLLTLTFDDGYDNEYTQGLPLLQKYGFTSTQFIITDLIDTPNYMTQAQIQGMYAAGNEIASHTITHDNLLTESQSQVTAELSQSQSTLEQLIGAPVTDIAYPYGLYNSAIQGTTADYYTAARGVEDGLNSKDNFNRYDLKVQDVYDTTTTAQIADWVSQAQATNTWLILVYHSVNPSPWDIYNVTPTQLDDQLAAIKASGITVKTMSQALAEVTPQL